MLTLCRALFWVTLGLDVGGMKGRERVREGTQCGRSQEVHVDNGKMHTGLRQKRSVVAAGQAQVRT